MTAFVQRKDPVRLMRRRILIVLLLLLVAAAMRGVWGVYQKERESRALRQEAEAQLAEIEKRENALRADIATLKSDRGVERVLREEYEMAERGEGVIVIVESTEPPSEPEPTTFEKFRKSLKWW